MLIQSADLTSIILLDVLSVRWLLLGDLPLKFSLKYLQLLLSLTFIGKFRLLRVYRELRQPRRRRRQERHKFTYLTMRNSSFARFARVIFIFAHFIAVLFLSPTWNDLFCSCVDDVSISWQMFDIFLLSPNRRYQFNSRIFRIHFASIMTWNNWEIMAETRSYIFGWRSRCRRRHPCLSSQWKGWTLKELYYCVCK